MWNSMLEVTLVEADVAVSTDHGKSAVVKMLHPNPGFPGLTGIKS